ncbi:MAG: hypothetical protein J6X49_12670 [Victivallales bacterium]|nr:hypothetical protein [Victivallales bacterium]
MMNDTHTESGASLEGTIVFLLANQGSKSESFTPYLYINQETVVKILYKGDNPFENTSLRPYDGRRVMIFGKQKSNGTFIIEKIESDEYISDGK